jgi:hypothetical protein
MNIHVQFGFNHRKNVSKCFFSENTWTIETKLPRNDHWKVLYKFSVFYADRKSKMATTALMLIYVLWWWPSWISDRHIKQKFCRGPSNDHFWAAWFQLSKWFQRRSVLKHVSHRRSSSLKLMNWLNPNCKRMIIGMSFTKFLFFMPIGNPRWPIGPVVSEKKLEMWKVTDNGCQVMAIVHMDLLVQVN